MSILFEEALKLPDVERRKLADDIYESLDGSNSGFRLTPEQEAELERRIEYSRLNPNDFSSWEDVRERLLSRR